MALGDGGGRKRDRPGDARKPRLDDQRRGGAFTLARHGLPSRQRRPCQRARPALQAVPGGTGRAIGGDGLPRLGDLELDRLRLPADVVGGRRAQPRRAHEAHSRAAGRQGLPGRYRPRRRERMGVLPARRPRLPQCALHGARGVTRDRHHYGLRLHQGASAGAKPSPPAYGQLDRRQPRHVDRGSRAQHRLGAPRRHAVLARGAVAAAAAAVRRSRARMARDPDHGGERLVLVVQPQARLGHGHDLGQPVPPSPAERLQADGAARAGAPLPADHPACAYARAQGAGREHEPQVAERLGVGEGRVLRRRLWLRRTAQAGRDRRACPVRRRRRARLHPHRQPALAVGARVAKDPVLVVLLRRSRRRARRQAGAAAAGHRRRRLRVRRGLRGPHRSARARCFIDHRPGGSGAGQG